MRLPNIRKNGFKRIYQEANGVHQHVSYDDESCNWIYHTSDHPINVIYNNGLFKDTLFWANAPYYMDTSDHSIVYMLDRDALSFIETCDYDFWDERAEQEVMELLNITSDDAVDVLMDKSTVFEYGGNGEDSWEVQSIQAQLSKRLGYDGALAEDEQGSVYMIPMTDLFNKMVIRDDETV